MHGLIGYLKQWMQDNKFVTYTLQSLNDKMVRAYFLRDPDSSQALIAQMLPFTQSQPLDLQALQLIYQQGGYWVYKIPGGKEPEAAPAQPTQQSTSTPAIRSGLRLAADLHPIFVHSLFPTVKRRAKQSCFSALSRVGEAFPYTARSRFAGPSVRFGSPLTLQRIWRWTDTMISVWGTSGTRKRRGTGATRLSKPEIQYGKKGLSVKQWKNK